MARAEKMIRLHTLWDILNKHHVTSSYIVQLDINSKAMDAAPVIHAWWRIVEGKIPVIVCSNCWGEADVKHKLLFHHCPFCGARMDLKVRENK